MILALTRNVRMFSNVFRYKPKAKEHWTWLDLGTRNGSCPGETWRSQTFALRSQLEEQSGQSGCHAKTLSHAMMNHWIKFLWSVQRGSESFFPTFRSLRILRSFRSFAGKLEAFEAFEAWDKRSGFFTQQRWKRSGISSMTTVFYLWSAKLCGTLRCFGCDSIYNIYQSKGEAVELFRMQNSTSRMTCWRQETFCSLPIVSFLYGGLFIFGILFVVGYGIFSGFLVRRLSAFSASLLFLLLCFFCFFAFPAFLLFLLLCSSCSSAFSASLLPLLLCFSATVLLCLSTYTILVFLFFSHVFLLLHFLLLCFFTSCLHCLFVFHVLLLSSFLFVSQMKP